ncbi:MAG: hypothetical protein M3388_12220 [Acidobacteriota bacterium]|nr:hypothetical protein [Acidobacteriota bacterium]
MNTENKNKTKNENFNSFDQVRNEQDEKTERGKNLITDVAMSCGNDFTVIDSLMEILELFAVKDSSMMIGDLAEDLQHHLFTWTREHDGISQWKESVLSGKKYQNAPGEQSPNSETSDAAKQISDLLNNSDLPEPIRDGVADGLLDLFNSRINQSEFHDYEKSPEYVEKILRGYETKQSQN